MSQNLIKRLSQPVSWQVAVTGGGSIGLGMNFLLEFFGQHRTIWLLLLGLFLFSMGISILILNSRFQQQTFWKYILWLAFIIVLTILVASIWSTANYGHWM